MSNLKVELLDKLQHLPPFEQVVALYEDKNEFFKEMHNYLVGGLVISNPEFFMMVKPINKSVEPSGQWYPECPDTWYIRWVAGIGKIKAMMDMLKPLPYLMFRRVTVNGDTKLRTYSWEKMYNKVKDE